MKIEAAAVFVLVLLTLAACGTSTSHLEEHGYPACAERMVGGRLLHDPGWVVAESDDARGHIYSFRSSYWGRIVQVTRVNRFCELARRVGNFIGIRAQDPAPVRFSADQP